ncbi:alkaline phosphatase D family protein [Auraticoccus monumenti]|uniref:Alkaline phosphatase D n=1 Tax=Auraticoccus monumenti TaxID=675864 RepID=A0A1G7B0L7_9ACTN|nr:alkaline phosphatase D family protein [Auraticoccus monumenti]SDE20664.1 alkaline phosphatase D [Auraticoccus monumenti]
MSAPTSPRLSRRRLLQVGGVSAATIALGISAPEQAGADPVGRDELFGLGVASGAPRPDGMVLWTRLAPEPVAPDGHGGMPLRPVPVRWDVATDDRFRDVVAQGHALAQPELAHAVHPRVTGLEPGTEYFYRFRVGRGRSPVGRFRTLPAPGETPERFSFGVTSCQAWYHGHFTAHRHLAQEPDLDLAVFVGDYIYEYGITASNLWRDGASVGQASTVEVETLEQYRVRYGLFKSDPHLQRLHARVPAVLTWDDHEVQNNYVGASSAYGLPDDLFAHRVAVAYRAFYENLPMDVDAMPEGPVGDVTTGLDVGRLARFSMLDTRQFRDPAATTPAERLDPGRSMLGKEQEHWVTERLEGSPATWNLLASGVVVSPISDDRSDQWDGYPAARQRLLTSMGRSRNGVVLTGDIHKHVASELRVDPTDPSAGNAGVELICTSVASDGDGAPTDGFTADWVRHDYVKLYDGRRGYVHVTLTPEQMESTFVVVPWVEADDTAPRQVVARFTTPAGQPRLDRA